MAFKMGPDAVLGYKDAFKVDLTTKADHQLECWFLAKLCHCGFMLNTLKWPKADSIPFFDPDAAEIGVPLDHSSWMTPMQWFQDGYDAVYVSQREKLVRFVQVTPDERRGFNSIHFSALLKKLAEEGLEADTVELVFVIPTGTLLVGTFKCPVNGEAFARDAGRLLSRRCRVKTEVVGVTCKLSPDPPVGNLYPLLKKRW